MRLAVLGACIILLGQVAPVATIPQVAGDPWPTASPGVAIPALLFCMLLVLAGTLAVVLDRLHGQSSWVIIAVSLVLIVLRGLVLLDAGAAVREHGPIMQSTGTMLFVSVAGDEAGAVLMLIGAVLTRLARASRRPLPHA